MSWECKNEEESIVRIDCRKRIACELKELMYYVNRTFYLFLSLFSLLGGI
jgi:hypothetical protein